MKKLSLVLFSLILCVASVFSCVSIPKSSVSAEEVNFTIYNGTKINASCDSDNRSKPLMMGKNIYEGSLECIISVELYDELLTLQPDISLEAMILNADEDGNSAYGFTFNNLKKFTYNSDFSNLTDYQYSICSEGTLVYYVVFCLPFEYVMTYDTSLNSSIIDNFNYSGDDNNLFTYFNQASVSYKGTVYTDYVNWECTALYYRDYITGWISNTQTFSYSLSIPEYKVSFYDYENNLINTQTITQGDFAVIPTAPIREGYNFIGWTSNVDGLGVTSVITQDVTFTATYKVKTYNVNYVDYDGTNISSQTIDYGNVSSVPSNPTRTGYTFSHWESSVSGIDASSAITQDVTFTAVYSINQYNIKFKNEDGTLIESKIYNYNVLPTCSVIPSKTGYTFIGWYDENDKVLSNVNADVVYFPKFQINKYNVTFKDYDGTQISLQFVEYNNFAVIPNNPSRVGYTFFSWQSDVNLVVGSPITSDVVYTAQYNINYYNVIFYDYLKSDDPFIFSVAYNTNLKDYVNANLLDFNYGMEYYNYQGLQFDLYLINGIQNNFVAKYNVESFVYFEELYITEDIELIKEYYLPLYFEILFNDDIKYTNENLNDLNGLSRFKTQFFEDKFLNSKNLTNYAIDIIQYYNVKKQGYDEEYINVKSNVLRQFGNSSIFDFNYLDIVNLKGQTAQINILEIEYFPVRYTAYFFYDVGNLRGSREYTIYYDAYVSEHYVNWYESGDEYFSHWVQVDYFDADDFIDDNSIIINDSPIFPVKCNGDMYFKAIKVAMSSDVPLQDNFNYKQLYLETWDFEEQTGSFFERFWGSVTDSIENVVMLLPRVAYNFFVWLIFESPIFSDLLDIISGGALKLIFINISFTLNLIEISFIGPLSLSILLLLFGFKWLI